ncbi:MAG: Ldh family oxidoreductase [Pseudomonadota bacterium]
MLETDHRFPAAGLTRFADRFLTAMGCGPDVAAEVAEHLVDADLCGVYSHGLFRLSQYADEAKRGRFKPERAPTLTRAEGGAPLVLGQGGFGIPAMRLAADEAVRQAHKQGTGTVGVAGIHHTGRLGAFAEGAAREGCLAIIFGGGARHDWPQVAPYGGAKGRLPTNPYAFGIPGGSKGPVVLDFATAAGAGGKVYAARAAERALPEGLCIDADGRPTTDPEDYFSGGALLPMAGPKGYGLALVAELLGEAVFGEMMDGLNWICVCIDLKRFRNQERYAAAAEECLASLRTCPPAPGFAQVEVPGEREAALRAERLKTGVPLSPGAVAELREAAAALGVAASELASPAR